MLVSALIYLCAAVLSVPIAKRLGLGSVLGYLLAGVLIGPYMLSLVGDQTAVMHFAEFGVVMMLFLVGLELELAEIQVNRRSAIPSREDLMFVSAECCSSRVRSRRDESSTRPFSRS